MKREITIVEFTEYCAKNSGTMFYYSIGDDRFDCARISIAFPPPVVFVNIKSVCFSDAAGNKMTLSGVNRIYYTHSSLTGIGGYQFECWYGDKREIHSFNTLQR